jgi:hypothetical protein
MNDYPNGVKVFFLTPTNLHDQKLRRICTQDGCGCYFSRIISAALKANASPAGTGRNRPLANPKPASV